MWNEKALNRGSERVLEEHREVRNSLNFYSFIFHFIEKTDLPWTDSPPKYPEQSGQGQVEARTPDSIQVSHRDAVLC